MPTFLEIPGTNSRQGGLDRSGGFATPFQPDPDHMVHVRYTFTIAGCDVSLMVSGNNPPDTELDRCTNAVLLGLVNIATQGTLECDVLPGEWVQFVKTGSGTGFYVTGQETIYEN